MEGYVSLMRAPDVEPTQELHLEDMTGGDADVQRQEWRRKKQENRRTQTKKKQDARRSLLEAMGKELLKFTNPSLVLH